MHNLLPSCLAHVCILETSMLRLYPLLFCMTSTVIDSAESAPHNQLDICCTCEQLLWVCRLIFMFFFSFLFLWVVYVADFFYDLRVPAACDQGLVSLVFALVSCSFRSFSALSM